MAVSLNEIEMDQHAKETQEFINEDRSTHDLNMEDFGIKLEEGQQSFQQYFENVKQITTLGMSTIFLWIMLTTEEFNSLPRDSSTGHVSFLAGATRLPYFDKMIMGYNAANATATYMYHLGEQHLMSQFAQQSVMLVWSTTIERIRNMSAYKQTNSFMRGFLQHQLQLEAGCHWLFTDFEKSTMATFKIKTTDENTTFLNVF